MTGAESLSLKPDPSRSEAPPSTSIGIAARRDRRLRHGVTVEPEELRRQKPPSWVLYPTHAFAFVSPEIELAVIGGG